jgi:protein ImuB
MTGEQYLCIHIKSFSSQALLRFRPNLLGLPVAVLHGESPFQLVCSLNKAARQIGVTEGMSRAEIDSFPSVILLKRSVIEEQATQAAVLECAGKYSPRIEMSSHEDKWSCILDIAGTDKLFGNPLQMVTRILDDLSTLGIHCTIAVSFNFYTSLCLAQSNVSHAQVMTSADEERQALATLPLTVLDISLNHFEIFSQWGVWTLGMLAVLPEKELIVRLGQEGQRLRQLARGEYPHLFQPIEPIVAMVEQIELDTPIDILESLMFGVSMMLDQLIARASSRALSLSAVTANLGLECGAIHSRVVRPAVPSNDRQLWIKLLQLDWTAHPPQSGVVSIGLKAETGEAAKIQLGLFSPQLPEAGKLDVTMARICAIVGEDRAGSIELIDTHEPEGFRLTPFTVSNTPLVKDVNKPEFNLPVIAMRCLRPAENIVVSLRHCQPYAFYFRGIHYEIEKAYGPWRATGGWWADRRWSMEHWDVIARPRNPSLNDSNRSILCCCIIHHLFTTRWQIEALYD